MTAPPKVLHVLGALVAAETAYATPTTLVAATHGLRLFLGDRAAYASIAKRQATYDGNNGIDTDTLFQRKRTFQAGYQFRIGLPVRFRGAAAEYEASNVPPWDAAMQMAGYTPTYAITPNRRVYTPTVPGITYKSGTVGLYTRGELWGGYGCLSSLSMAFDGMAPALWTFDTVGILDDQPDDVAKPSITYPAASLSEPVSAGVSLTIGDWPAIMLKSGGFNANRSIDNVANDLTLAAGLLGFVPWGWTPELKTTVAATALVGSPFHTSAGLDPYRMQAAAADVGGSIEFGVADANGNMVRILSTSMQLMDVTPGNEGPTATWDLTWQLNNHVIECEST